MCSKPNCESTGATWIRSAGQLTSFETRQTDRLLLKWLRQATLMSSWRYKSPNRRSTRAAGENCHLHNVARFWLRSQQLLRQMRRSLHIWNRSVLENPSWIAGQKCEQLRDIFDFTVQQSITLPALLSLSMQADSTSHCASQSASAPSLCHGMVQLQSRRRRRRLRLRQATPSF